MSSQTQPTLVLAFEGLSADAACALVPGVTSDEWTRLSIGRVRSDRDTFWRSLATGESRSRMPNEVGGRLSFRPMWSVLEQAGRVSACVAWPGTHASRIRDAALVTDAGCRVAAGPREAWLCPRTVAWPEEVWSRFREQRVHWEDVTLEQVRELVPELNGDAAEHEPLIRATRTRLAAVATVQSAAMGLVETAEPEVLFVWYGLGGDWPRVGILGKAWPRVQGFLRGCVGFLRTAFEHERVVVVTRDALQWTPGTADKFGEITGSRSLAPCDAGTTLFQLFRADAAGDRPSA